MRKHEYTVLDGLRGIAAFAVAAFHASGQILEHDFGVVTFLAVDFFFCLSGFVLSHAYGEALTQGRLSPRGFFGLRVKRLYPMIVAGVVLGLAVNLVQARLPLLETLVTSAATLALIPAGLLFHDEAYAINNALWSLAFEVIAGIALGALAGRGNRLWAAIALTSAALLALAVFDGGDLGTFGFAGVTMFVLGVPRVMLPFASGVLIHRALRGRTLTISPAWSVGLLLLLLFGIGPASPALNLAGAALLVPAIVVLGALANPLPGAGLMRMLGTLSYPFYVLHLPLVYALSGFADDAPPLAPWRWALAAGALALTALLAAVLERGYDRPVRAWLARRSAGRAAPRPA